MQGLHSEEMALFEKMHVSFVLALLLSFVIYVITLKSKREESWN